MISSDCLNTKPMKGMVEFFGLPISYGASELNSNEALSKSVEAHRSQIDLLFLQYVCYKLWVLEMILDRKISHPFPLILKLVDQIFL